MNLRSFVCLSVFGIAVASSGYAETFHIDTPEGFVTKSDSNGNYLTPEGNSADEDDTLRIYTEEETFKDEDKANLAKASVDELLKAYFAQFAPGVSGPKIEQPELDADSVYPALTLAGTGTKAGVKSAYRVEVNMVFSSKKKAKLTSPNDFLSKSNGAFLIITIVGTDLAFKKYDKDLSDLFESIKAE